MGFVMNNDLALVDDARNDVGIAITTLDGVKAYTYSYYKTDELLLVKGEFNL